MWKSRRERAWIWLAKVEGSKMGWGGDVAIGRGAAGRVGGGKIWGGSRFECAGDCWRSADADI